MAHALATVFFIDVGRGSSQLVLFPNSEAVLIDSGENSEPVERLIDSLSITRFSNVIISHWHSDHCLGMPRLLRRYRERIKVVRVPGKPQQSDGKAMYGTVYQQIKDLRWPEDRSAPYYGLSTLEHDVAYNGLVAPVPNASPDANLRIVYPDREERDRAEEGTDTNQASGILALECGSTRILFPGDAGKLAFESLSKRLGTACPINCNVLAAPHHAGRLSRTGGAVGNYPDSYQWLYREILAPDQVVIGSGTEKNAKHPRVDHIVAIASRCKSIRCTQLTDQCHNRPEDFPRGLLGKYSHAGKHQASGTACMGTIVVEVFRDHVSMHNLQEHQTAIDKQLDPNLAMCRRFAVKPSTSVTA